MGFDMQWASFNDADSESAHFRLNVGGMAEARRALQAAGVLEWGPAGPIEELRYDPDNFASYEAFQARLANYLNGTPRGIISQVTPGKVIAVKLLLNDGLRLSPEECGTIAGALGTSTVDYLQAFAAWCRGAKEHDGIVVW